MSYWGAAGRIVLTGGMGGDKKTTAHTSLLDVQTDQWEQGSNHQHQKASQKKKGKAKPPKKNLNRARPKDLNVARHSHASMSLGKQVYVACGYGDGNKGNYGELLNSVEMLRMGA